MDRFIETGGSASPPSTPGAPSVKYPTQGDPLTATPASKPGEWWFHMIQESMRRVLVAAGITPDYSNLDLLTTAIQAINAAGLSLTNDFRLTLTNGTPVTTADVVGATTVYMTPYKSNRIALYNGTSWVMYNTAQLSLALGTLTNDQGYDVFCYANSGVPTLEILAWSNNTTRATALVYQDGVLCKSGALTRRYVGSFLTTSTTTTEDSASKRYVFNYNNRVSRPQTRIDGNATWSYNNSTVRQARGSSSNQLNFFIGVVENPIDYFLTANSQSGTSTSAYNGIGLNSTSAYTNGTACSSGASNDYLSNTVSGSLYPTLGKNYVAWLEWTGGAVTFSGTNGDSLSMLAVRGLA